MKSEAQTLSTPILSKPVISKIEIINQLDNAGLLRPLICAGLFPAKVLHYRDVYYYYDAQLKMGFNKMDALYNAEINFNISYGTVYRAINAFK